MKEIIEEKYVTVMEDAEKSLILVSWFGGCTSEQYRMIMLEALDYTEKNEIRHWITDNRKAHILRLHDQDWLIKEIIPEVKNRFKKIGVIDSADEFRNAGVSIVQRETRSFTFKIRNFASLEEAYEWIG